MLKDGEKMKAYGLNDFLGCAGQGGQHEFVYYWRILHLNFKRDDVLSKHETESKMQVMETC